MKIYNTLTRTKQDFIPLVPGEISMYVCGMTVYDYCHLGHARVMVAFDAITRYLRARDWRVNYVRNITDIDDKILKRAAENNESYPNLTRRFIAAMHEDETQLGVIRPDQEPKATEHIDHIISLIQTLITKGYAYTASNGDVYYSINQFDAYGKLSGKKPEDLIAGARVDVEEAKKDPRDFALWKSVASHEAHWDSPWGPGRPGWHIECSAMSMCCLGETFDIHGGGPDLPFPHHENEIAQSEAASGKTYARYWMHAGAVRVDNEKMSKSLGNFFTIREILSHYHPEVVRFFLLSSHYRSPINYSSDSMLTAKAALERCYVALRGMNNIPIEVVLKITPEDEYIKKFVEAMDDDFSTPEAMAVLFELTRLLNIAKSQNDTIASHKLATQLKSLGAILGLLQDDPDQFLQTGQTSQDFNLEQIEKLIAQRETAKTERQFQLADDIRADLKAQGILLEDTRAGTIWRKA